MGSRSGKNLGFIKQYLTDINGNEAMNELNDKGVLSFAAPDGTQIELGRDDLLIDVSKQGGYVTEEDRNVTVVLDTNLTPELIEEGFVREIISKIQTMRKEAGFEVLDRIKVYHQGNEVIEGIFARNGESIANDVLALEIVSGSCAGYTKEWNINGETVTLGVEKQ